MSNDSDGENTDSEKLVPSAKKWDVGPTINVALQYCGRWSLRIICGLNHISPILTGLATVGVVWIAYWQWDVLKTTDRTLHDTLVASNRAWITPVAAQFYGNPKANQPIRYSVRYGNIGKEPATQFVAQEDFGTIAAPQRGASFYTVFERAILKDVCSRTRANDGGAVVYPSSDTAAYTYMFGMTGFDITPDIETGEKLIFVNGCFAYKTFGIEKKSEYCFIFIPGQGGTANASATQCPFGNRAY